MSLYALADHMASKGRNGDSMLVHMAPSEVAGLHALALAHGEKVTINPETGLPEMFSLKKILKAVLPAVAGFALGPAGFGLMSSLGAAATVGGATALATGSLSRGLMAGLGAYGGSSFGEGLSSLGATAVSPEALAAANASGDITSLAAAKDAASMAGVAAPTGFEAAKQGFQTAMRDPKALMNTMGGGMKTFQAGYMAAAPILADQSVPTTTKMPESQGYLRPYVFDPYTQGLQALTPVSHKDAYGPPTGGKAGGLMRLANGGAVAFADGGKTQEIQDWWAANEGKGSQADLDRWLATSGYSAEQINAALPQFGVADLNAAISGAQQRLGSQTPASSNFVTGPVVGPGGNDNFQMAGGTRVEGYSRDYTPEQRIGINKAWIRAQQDAGYGVEGLMRDMEKTGVTVQDLALSYGMDPGSVGQYFLRHGADPSFGGIDANWDRKKQDEFIKWQMQQTNQFGQNIGESWAKQGITDPYSDPLIRAGAQEQVERNARRQALRSGAGGGGFTTGPGGGGGFTTGPGGGGEGGGGGGGGGGTQPNPVVTPPPPPPPPYVPPDPFDWQKTPITRLPEFGPIKPEDAMSGRSLEAYNALMGKGSTATKQWDQAPMRPYLPQSGNQFFIQRGDTVVDTKNPVATTTQMPLSDPTKMPTQDPGPGMEWYFDNLNKMWLKRPQEQISGAKEGGVMRGYALGGLGSLGGYSDGGRLLKGPGDGVSDSIPATIGDRRPARLADGEFVVPARIVSELGNGSTDAGARKLYAMMDRVQRARGKTTGKGRVAANTRADKYLPA